MSIEDIRRAWRPPLGADSWPVVVRCMVGLGGEGWDGQAWHPVTAETDVSTILGVVWPSGDDQWAAAVPLIWGRRLQEHDARELVRVWLRPEETEAEMDARIEAEADAEIAGHLEGNPATEGVGTGADLRLAP